MIKPLENHTGYLPSLQGTYFSQNTCKSKEPDGEHEDHPLAKANSTQSAICLND